MVDSIAELIATYAPEFQGNIRSNTILDRGKVARVDERLFAGSNGALKMGKQMPIHYWQMLT